jgi:hypothetical protein
MAGDHRARPEIGQHFGGDVAGEGTGGLAMAVLAADGDTVGERGEGHDQGRRRTHHEVDPLPQVAGIANDLLEFRHRSPEPVHFPVAGDQWPSR